MAEETAVAFTYNGTTHAVMMATPADLEDFALGFSLSEAVIDTPDELVSLGVIRSDLGIELRMWIVDVAVAMGAPAALAGPVGCGLCGIESSEEAVRPAPRCDERSNLSPSDISSAMASLPDLATVAEPRGAVHAAAFWRPVPGKAAAGTPDGSARRCRPSQRARQARGSASLQQSRCVGWSRLADQPGFGRDGAKAARLARPC